MNDQRDISSAHGRSNRIERPAIPVIVHEHADARCPVCGGAVGIGLKEEPSCWKVYEVCTNEDRRCVDRRAGTVSKASIDHDDEAFERARTLVATRH